MTKDKLERHEPPDDDEIEGEDEPIGEPPKAPEPPPADAPKPDASGPWGRDVKE